MEDSKLFKTLWRFNALIIAVAGVMGVIVLLFVLYMLYQDATRTRHHNEIVNIDPKAEIEERFRMGDIDKINGSDSVIIPLYSDQNFSLEYSGKSTVSTRNLLFTHLNNETSHWLFPNNKFLLAEHRLLNESGSWNKEQPVRAILISLVKQDTNEDQRLTESDRLTLALTTPEGKQYTEVLDGIDTILGYELIGQEKLVILYNRDGVGRIAYIALDGFKVLKETALPKVGEK